jgi:hypothetical protein
MNPQHLLNDSFFMTIIKTTKDGGIYFYPAENYVYQIIDGKMCGTKKGIETIKKITSENFHKNLVASDI